MEEAARSPSPFAAGAPGRGRSVCWQSSPGCGGWPGGDSRAAANFRRWAEPRGKQPAGGRCRTRTAVPTSVESERWGDPASGDAAVGCQSGGSPVWCSEEKPCPADAPAAGGASHPGKRSRAKPSPAFPVGVTQGAGEPRAAPCLSFAVSVSPALPRRRQQGWPGSGILACESAKPYYFPTTVSSSLLVKLDPAVHNSH